MRAAQARQSIGANVRIREIERIARSDGVAERNRYRETPGLGQEFVDPHRARDVRRIIGEVGRVLPELSELPVAPRHADCEIRDVRRVE